VYFTFLDGAIGYDCVSCGSRCCHGLGFAMRQDELIPFLGKAPKIAPFLQLREHGADAFDLIDGCWLLEPDGRCGLEVKDGRAAKPSVCRLFPLYTRLIGAELVVDLRLLYCPIQDAATLGPGAAVLRHEEAAAEIEELARPFAKPIAVAPGSPDDLLGREAKIRDATRELLDSADSASLIARAHGVDEAPLQRLRASWRGYFEVEPGFDRPRPIGLSIPMLRMAALTTPGAAPWPRLTRALPAQLLAASFYMELSARAGREPSLRGIGEVWRSTASVRELLARWEQPRTLPETPLHPGTPPEIERAYRQVQSSTRPIGEALIAAELPVALRPLLVRAVADRLL
jgi:hypothetical protein